MFHCPFTNVSHHEFKQSTFGPPSLIIHVRPLPEQGVMVGEICTIQFRNEGFSAFAGLWIKYTNIAPSVAPTQGVPLSSQEVTQPTAAYTRASAPQTLHIPVNTSTGAHGVVNGGYNPPAPAYSNPSYAPQPVAPMPAQGGMSAVPQYAADLSWGEAPSAPSAPAAVNAAEATHHAEANDDADTAWMYSQ
ncbi:hypothetical protein KIPB_001284 [Kipferlia bialata]|uniref:Uncharacterized protein n=1 Tax=Kipferlia bialata TaxID=797122 RepID=A0A391NTZ0_9EUKA|nr:hypothetical protein KIPB_001284 [Kipferlia bialata]|eukprot:g1284.t1